MSLVDTMKKIGAGAVDAGNPVAVMYGTVTRANPLEVNVDQRFTLPKDFLVLPQHLEEKKLMIGSTEYTLQEPLQAGDRVLLLRMQGGQNYLLLDRVVE